MRSQIRKALQTVGTPLILSALIWGCESNPADPSIVPDENTTANQAARISVDLYNTVASVQTASEFMRGAGEKVELQDVNINNPSGAFAHAKRARQVVLAELAAHGAAINHIDGIAADSLLWQVTNQKPFLGYTETVRLFYDAATGKARLEAIKYNFDNRHWQQYDSAAIRADLNGTLFDDSDDVLLSLQQLQRYKAGHHLQQKQSTFTPDAYAAGSEPTGGIFESTTIYNESSFIQKTEERAEWHQATGGQWQKAVTYSDGSSSSEKAIFNTDETGSFEEVRRDGTKISGTFDSAEHDGNGSFSKNVAYPVGSDPVSIAESGTFRMDADSSLHGAFSKEVTFLNGEVRRENVVIDESYSGGLKTTRIQIENADGSNGVVVMEERVDGAHIKAEVTEANGAFFIIEIDSYSDGSARLTFSGWPDKQSFENGEAPAVEGIINFNPDSSGTGTITDGNNTRSVSIAPNGGRQFGS